MRARKLNFINNIRNRIAHHEPYGLDHVGKVCSKVMYI